MSLVLKRLNFKILTKIRNIYYHQFGRVITSDKIGIASIIFSTAAIKYVKIIPKSIPNLPTTATLKII